MTMAIPQGAQSASRAGVLAGILPAADPAQGAGEGPDFASLMREMPKSGVSSSAKPQVKAVTATEPQPVLDAALPVENQAPVIVKEKQTPVAADKTESAAVDALPKAREKGGKKSRPAEASPDLNIPIATTAPAGHPVAAPVIAPVTPSDAPATPDPDQTVKLAATAPSARVKHTPVQPQMVEALPVDGAGENAQPTLPSASSTVADGAQENPVVPAPETVRGAMGQIPRPGPEKVATSAPEKATDAVTQALPSTQAEQAAPASEKISRVVNPAAVATPVEIATPAPETVRGATEQIPRLQPEMVATPEFGKAADTVTQALPSTQAEQTAPASEKISRVVKRATVATPVEIATPAPETVRATGRQTSEVSPETRAILEPETPVGAKSRAVEPGEATALLNLVERKASSPAGPVINAPDGDPAPSSRPLRQQAADPAPVRGQGLTSAQAKEIPGLIVAAEQAAPHSAVAQRVAAASAVVPSAETSSGDPVPDTETASGTSVAVEAKAGDIKSLPPSGRQLPPSAIAPQAAAKPADPEPARTAKSRPESAATPGVESASSSPSAAPAPVIAAPHVSAPPASLSIASSAPGLGALLGQQVVDLGISGRWIDDIAQQIARVADNPGHGRFQIASPVLGAVRVDITPGAAGSDVVMTVDSDAAQNALLADHKRLIQDAQLASVRLGEVRVDRVASLAQPHDGGTDTTARQDNGAGQQTAQGNSQGTLAQNNGQGAQHNRPDASALGQQANGNGPKTPFTRAVLNGAAPAEVSTSDRGRPRDNARYA